LNKDASDNAVEWLQSQAVAQRKILQKADEALLAFQQQNIIETRQSMRKTAEEAMLTYNQELAKAIAAREVALAKFTEKHPEVRTLSQVIESTRKRFEEEVQRVKEMDQAIDEAKIKLNSLQREVDACEINFKGIIHRMEEARLSADEKTTTVNLVEPAVVPVKPVKPRKLIIILLALVIAPFCGSVMSLWTHRMENRVWNPDEIASETGLRLLGAVTHSRCRDRRKLAMAGYLTKLEAVAESFAALRAVMESDKSWKTLLVTSSTAEEGKTISCCNLAVSFAESGARTLIIDLDMRRPRLRQVFGISVPSQNMLHTQVLADESVQDFASLPVKTNIPNLDLLATLPASVRPAGVLGSPRIRQFIEWAKGNYDKVLIDSPPMSVGSDSMFLGSVVDCVVLVCRFNRTKKSMLHFAVSRLQDCGAKILGLIVNDVRATSLGPYSTGYHYRAYGGERRRWKNPPIHA
jgi:capsular exopolysaccharide synthesis family protein